MKLRKLGSICFALAIGIFFGLFILGTLLRVVFHVAFRWSDSGPIWVNMIILILTLASVYASLRIFVKERP